MKYTYYICAKYFSTIHAKPKLQHIVREIPARVLDRYKKFALKKYQNTRVSLQRCTLYFNARWHSIKSSSKIQAVFQSVKRWIENCQNILLSAETNHRSRKSSCPESRVNRDSTNYTFQTGLSFILAVIEARWSGQYPFAFFSMKV